VFKLIKGNILLLTFNVYRNSISRLFLFKTLLFMSLVVSSCQVITCQADVVSLDSDYVAGQANIVDKLNNDRHGLTDGANNVRGVFAGGVQSSGQIKSETVGEENMADNANPRIRTAEGASCNDLVYSGFLAATSANLIISVPAGVAYPDGYRVERTSATGATLTASRWTWYYINTSGSLVTNVATIGSTQPSDAANSAILFRASTDTAAINTITDLRRTSCAAGPLESIADVTGEATLEDLLVNGSPVRQFSQAGRTPQGLARGAFVSWDTHTTFKVTSGSLYINGKYRSVSTDTTVTTSADAPLTGGSGIDTGTVTGGPLRYCVYGVADQDNVKTWSVSYSTSCSAPTGVTNARLIGSINIDTTNLFTSSDTVTAHALSEREIPGAWINYNEATSTTITGSFNVSSVTDNGTGDTSIAWRNAFNDAAYAVVASTTDGTLDNPSIASLHTTGGQTASAIRMRTYKYDSTTQDETITSVIALGDTRK